MLPTSHSLPSKVCHRRPRHGLKAWQFGSIQILLYLCGAFQQGLTSESPTKGEVLEWLKRHAWKVCKRQKRFAGSNPALSAKRLQSDCKMVVREAFKTRGNRCRTRSYNDFSLYAVHRPDGLPLGSNSHQSVKFCYRNCYIKLDVAISVAVTAK